MLCCGCSISSANSYLIIGNISGQVARLLENSLWLVQMEDVLETELYFHFVSIKEYYTLRYLPNILMASLVVDLASKWCFPPLVSDWKPLVSDWEPCLFVRNHSRITRGYYACCRHVIS